MPLEQAALDIFLLGANYNTCPLEVRERLALPHADLERVLEDAVAVAEEAVILSTCHRIELYALARSTGGLPEGLLSLIGRWSGLDRSVLLAHSYTGRGKEAIRHLFAVSAGLDSVLLGEGQVLGQVKEALGNSQAFQAAGPTLSALFRHAIIAGKRVRAETSLGEKDSSLSSAAVELAHDVMGGLSGKRALVIGAGKMGALAALALRERKVAAVDVVSRTPGRALEVAASVHGRALGFDSLEDSLRRCHLAISCTSTAHPVLQYSLVRQVQDHRDSPVVLIDLAVPRDVEPRCGEIEGVTLFDVDGLARERSISFGAAEEQVLKAKVVVAEEVDRFQAWLSEREIVPTISSLYAWADGIRRGELVRAGASLDGLSEEEHRTLDALTGAIVKKLLHHPAIRLKRAALDGDSEAYRKLMRELFPLPE